jgi:hypothetical protein
VFLIEAMVAGGPRKSISDYEDASRSSPELCEDAAGVLAWQGAQLWWLCDGTSEGSYLPPVGGHAGLSTRMLARDLGECFVAIMIAPPPEAGDVEGAIFERLRGRWQERLDTYLDTLRGAGLLERFYEASAQNSDGSYALKWSSTFLGGQLVSADAAQTASLWLLQAGDAGAIIFRDGVDGGVPEIVAPNRDRIAVIATIEKDEAVVRVIGPSGGMAARSVDRVAGFAAMSDGAIKADLAAFLHRLASIARDRSIEDIRQGLAARTDRSFDDKSLVFGRRI